MTLKTDELNRVDQHVGRMLRLYRKSLGLTRQDLCERADLPARTLRRFECGQERVPPLLLRNLCLLLKIRPNALFDTIRFAEGSEIARQRRRRAIL